MLCKDLIFAENVLFRSIAVLNIMLFQSLFMDACLYIVTLTKGLLYPKSKILFYAHWYYYL